jgi:D-xylose transport system permease protein
VGAAVGLIQGLVITVIRVPSFIVTLAGLIGWQGLLLYTLGEGGTRNITDDQILGLTDTFFSSAVAWPLGIVLIAAYVGSQQLSRIRRIRAGLRAESLTAMVIRQAVVAAAGLVAIGVFTRDRGLPLAVLILLALVVIFDLVSRRTLFGRHVYAVGGNAEAARRAGINVPRIRLIVFVMSGTFAAAGGIMAASRLLAVNQASGGGTFLLLAIAGAVIGGTSLFGGRGTVYSALLGALVLGSLANGIALLGLSSDFEYMLTAAVLLAAVIVDALARRGRQASVR